jgi:ABC-type bacteriocin/lantibiotic exporter with double-glycine peptidase domain
MKSILRDVNTFLHTVKQLTGLLTDRQRKQAVGVFILVVIGAAFETLGVAAVLPFIYAVIDPAALWNNQYIQLYSNFFHIEKDSELIVSLGIAISVIYIIKNLFMMFITYIENKFKANFAYELSKLMLHSYMKRPYIYFLGTNSAEMIRGLNDDINSINDMMTALFKIFSIVFMMAGIGIFLVIQAPGMAVGIMVLAVIVFAIIVLVIKKKIRQLGKLKIQYVTEAYKYAYQAVNGIKEITIMKREDYFLNSYTGITSKKKEADISYNCISVSPERIVEATFVCGILGIVCVQVGLGKMSASLITNLAAFAVGAMRIMPSLSTLTTRMTQIMYLRPALSGICLNIEEARKQELQLADMQSACDMADNSVEFKDEVILSDIFWKYPESEEYVLQNANVSIRRGDCVALTGKSGAGKTTLADILLGLFKPEKGKVLMDGIDIYSIPYAWSKIIGYVPQTVYLIDDTIRNNVSFGIAAEKIEDTKVWSALEKAQMKEFVENLPQGLDTVIGESGVKFSGGQRQRIAIARALYHDPEILVFDEATAALDGETESAVMDAINSLKGMKTLIIIAHRLNTISHCNCFYEVGNHVVTEKTREEILGLG